MTLAHDLRGDGPAVLLLHSTVCDRRMWDPQIPALTAAGFRTLRCAFHGFGDTPAPSRPYDQARDVVDLLDRYGIAEAALVGASGGGRVALEIAARWPERVTALVLLCTAAAGIVPGAELSAFGAREDALLDAGDVDGATDLNVETWVGPAADAATRERVREMQRHAFAVQLAATEEPPPIRVPHDPYAIAARTLLVSGAHDLPDFRVIAAGLAAKLRRAEHRHLDWAGHLPSLERPDEVNRLLTDFLNG